MTALRTTSFGHNRQRYLSIMFAGTIAGTLDIFSALIDGRIRGLRPLIVLQAISSGILGRPAFKGGIGTAILGTILHYLIALTAALVYFAASLKIRSMNQRYIVAGLLYGSAIYVFMTFVVVPLSAAPFKLATSLWRVLTGLSVHMLCIGLPISTIARKFSGQDSRDEDLDPELPSPI